MTSRLRSLLFAPATSPDLLRKLPRSGPDAVVIDLEDAVPADAKGQARTNAVSVASELTSAADGPAVYVRVNSVASQWFVDDVRDGLCDGVAGVVVPKVESREHVAEVQAALHDTGRDGVPVMAGIETVAGVSGVGDILDSGVHAAYFGAEDFVVDLGGVRRRDNLEVLYARSRVAMAARSSGVAALDMIVADFHDDDRFVEEAAMARALGFGGKLCIHPRQVALANDAFVPSAEELDRARRVVEAYEAATAEGRAAIAVDGQMIDEPLARQARAVLDAAG